MSAYLGFDPGGRDGFGWAVLSGEGFPLTLTNRGVTSNAQDAVSRALACAGSEVGSVGIDAPLFWSPTGDRLADQEVRQAITRRGSAGGTVSSVNSLRGACLIQGIMAAILCQRKLGSNTPITEAHPKALLWLLGRATPVRRPTNIVLGDLEELVAGSAVGGANEHERDAALSAIAAYAMESKLSGWIDLFALERDVVTPLAAPPGYWMPLGQGAA